jgi:hypothetical protein
MSFLKSLFGRKSDGPPAEPAPLKEIEHKGFLVRATPYAEAGQYQTCGVIEKLVDGVKKEYRFVRADRFGTAGEAADFAITKGRQIVDEQGDRIFG